MLFHTFHSQEERRSFGGSAFIEIQFCKVKPETKIKKLVDIRSINNWQTDSIYVYADDIEVFDKEYSNIFNCGIYNNLKSGLVDLFGINYYSSDMIEIIIAKILNNKPTDYEILVEWLNIARLFNGFYILGI